MIGEITLQSETARNSAMTIPVDGYPEPAAWNDLSRNFEELVPIRIRKISDDFQEVVNLALRGMEGVRFTDARILAYLAERDTTSMADISRDLKIDKAWISRLVRELSDRRLVIRERDQSDSRSLLVALTDTGRMMYNEVMKIAIRHNDTVMADIDLARAITFLDTLEANVAQVITTLREQRGSEDGR